MKNPQKSSPRYSVFKGLKSPKEKMLVAKYGKIARSATDLKSTEEDELRASVFGYVLESYSTDEKFDVLHEKRKGIHDTFKAIAVLCACASRHSQYSELYRCSSSA